MVVTPDSAVDDALRLRPLPPLTDLFVRAGTAVASAQPEGEGAVPGVGTKERIRPLQEPDRRGFAQ